MSEWITDRRPTEQILTRIYTAGYERGHHDTVESTYLHIHPEDVGTYFSDDVKELMQEFGNEANARLIAAAPELLEALEKALNESGCDGDQCGTEWHELARAAITKAKGEQP